MTAPPNYWPLRRRLLARGAGSVSIAPVWPTDWLLSTAVGFGPLLRKTGVAIASTYRSTGQRPIIVVAHSAGGLVTRLALSRVAFRGRVAAVAEAVATLITLGTPHRIAALRGVRRHAGHVAARFLDRTNPGAHFAPRTRYVTVGSRAVRAVGTPRTPLGLLASYTYTQLLGPDALGAEGDGLVPLVAAHLDGARQITLPDATHGHVGRRWYGDEPVVDQWWPQAVEEWHAALESRRIGAAVSRDRQGDLRVRRERS